MTKQQKIAYYEVIKQALVRKYSIDQITTLLQNMSNVLQNMSTLDETQVNDLIDKQLEYNSNIYLQNTDKLFVNGGSVSNNIANLTSYDTNNYIVGVLSFLQNGDYTLKLHIEFVSGSGKLALYREGGGEEILNASIASGDYSYDFTVTDDVKYNNFRISTVNNYMRGSVAVTLEKAAISTEQVNDLISTYLTENQQGVSETRVKELIAEFNTCSNVTITYNGQTTPTILDAYSTDPFGDGSLKHFYPLDDNVNDIVGSANGTPVNITYEALKYNNGAKFNGVNATVDVSANLSSNFSVSMWVKMEDIPTTYPDYRSIVFSTRASTNAGLSLSFDNAQGDGFTYSIVLMDREGKTISNVVRSDNTWTPNELYHIVMTVSDNTVKVYRDGAIVSSYNMDTPYATQSAFYIGREGTHNDYNAKGIIDHVQIFDRVLTQAEITQLYNATYTPQQTLDATDPANNSNPELQNQYRPIEDPDDLAEIWRSKRTTNDDGSISTNQLSDTTAYIDDNEKLYNTNTSEFNGGTVPVEYETQWRFIDNIQPPSDVDTTYSVYVKLKQGSNLEVDLSTESVGLLVRLFDNNDESNKQEEYVVFANGTTAPTALEGWYKVDITLTSDMVLDNSYWVLNLLLVANRSSENSTGGGYDSNNSVFLIEDVSWKVKQ